MRLVLCDDHLMFLEALSVALAAHGHTVEATVTDPGSVVGAVAALDPDMVILDVAFPQASGVDAARAISSSSPDTRIMMLSATTDPSDVRAAFEAGATGFVQKDESIQGILTAVERLERGEVAIDPTLLRAAMRRPAGAGDGPEVPRAVKSLTDRERDVLRRIVAGETTTEIAGHLGVATSTARTHIQAVLVKLGVHTRLQASAFAVAHHVFD